MRQSRHRRSLHQVGSIETMAIADLHQYIRTVLTPAVFEAVHSAVATKNLEIQPLLNLLNEPYYKQRGLKLAGGIVSTNIQVRLFDSLEEQGSLSFSVPHNPFFGSLDSQLPQLRKRFGYGDTYQTSFGNDRAPLAIFGEPVGDADFYDEYNRIIGHCKVIKTQFPPWINQFQGLPDPASIAGFYSSTIRAWLARLNCPIDTFMRRPRAPYTIAMSPELNLALTIALQMKNTSSDGGVSI